MIFRRIFLVLMVTCCGLPAARAVIVYTDVADVWLFSVGEPIAYGIDFNGDGVVEVTLESTRMSFSVFATETSRVAGFLSPPPDIGSKSLPFSGGDLIGPDEDESWEWNDGNSLVVSYAMLSQPVNIGLWDVGASFLAVSFEIDGQMHYGWVDIYLPFPGNGGYVRGFAYETTPNMAIVAGAIPEPATTALFVAVLMGVCAFMRRNVPR